MQRTIESLVLAHNLDPLLFGDQGMVMEGNRYVVHGGQWFYLSLRSASFTFVIANDRWGCTRPEGVGIRGNVGGNVDMGRRCR